MGIPREMRIFRPGHFDSDAWQQLARKHLKHRRLPNWNYACTVEAMALWCDRLDIDYESITNTPHAEFVTMSPHWPLRAFVGLLLEAIEAQRGNYASLSN